jgi:hypothetical protein
MSTCPVYVVPTELYSGGYLGYQEEGSHQFRADFRIVGKVVHGLFSDRIRASGKVRLEKLRIDMHIVSGKAVQWANPEESQITNLWPKRSAIKESIGELTFLPEDKYGPILLGVKLRVPEAVFTDLWHGVRSGMDLTSVHLRVYGRSLRYGIECGCHEVYDWDVSEKALPLHIAGFEYSFRRDMRTEKQPPSEIE